MFKSLRVPIFVALAALVIFLLQGYWVVSLTKKNMKIDVYYELVRESSSVKENILNINFKPNLLYEYAILDKNLKPIFSKLTVTPPNFNFKTKEYRNFVYYRDYTIYNDNLYFIIVAKKINYAGLNLISFIIVLCAAAIIFFVTKLTYKSVTIPLLERSKMTNVFFNDAMHELKTPLGVASINLDMMKHKDKHTHRIKGALKQMKVTYEDVEYYIKKDRVSFPKEILNISSFLERRVRFSSTIAHIKKISIQQDIEPGILVYMSEVELTRLIDNNISNSIKYSKPESTVIVKLKQEGNFAVFSVEDFGIGIKDIEKIWNRYERQNESEGGFGLGLNIVLKICLKYRIIYDVQSEYGKGSIFIYKIPLYKELPLDNVR